MDVQMDGSMGSACLAAYHNARVTMRFALYRLKWSVTVAA